MRQTIAPEEGIMYVGSRTLATRLHSDWEIPDADTILRYAEDALNRPSHSYWRDEELWETHTLMFSSAPDSDDTVSQSNTATILRDLGGAYKRFPGAVESAEFGHWTYSHFDCVKVRVLYSNGEIHPAFTDAVAIAEHLRESYPVWDENDYDERQWKDWERYVKEEISYQFDSEYREDNLPEISDEDWDLFISDIRESISEKFGGYYDEVYASEEDWTEAANSATALIGSVRPDATFSPLF